MGRLFGTDGVRGRANAELTPELALSVARAAAGLLADRDGTQRPVAVVGRDPRASGEMLEAAVVAGLVSAGADVLRAGVLPTPALAYLTGRTGANLGVMISASHNPMPDNGIKLFSSGGHKLPDAVEAAIEHEVGRHLRRAGDAVAHRPTGAQIGRVRDLPDAVEDYAQHLLSTVPRPLTGVRLVVDGAHGSAAACGPDVYRRAGATVATLGCEPDGWNINDGVGSTHLEPLIAAVRAQGADLGLAHDGDADRCLAVTAEGDVVDGDAILAISALAMHERGQLREDTVVATVMSNLGFHHTMRGAGIAVQTTAVGDRYVLEALRARNLSLGGEQSGHLVFLEHATTGDGVLTGLALLSRMAETGASLAELASVLTRLPQTLINVPVRDRIAVVESDEVADAVNSVEEELGDSGRVLLRPSGTEQLVRVMVEAPTQEQADSVADRLAKVVAAAG
ncbi:MAG: phosphoglucosamine mutase [Frankiales bacterium]|nr:phosphoglucosamine mutase [Frankiales bacterium]